MSLLCRAVVLAFVSAAGACAGSGELCRRDAITGSEQCSPATNNYGEAAVGAGAATAAWVAVGCTVNGCPAPDHCNEKTKQCESVRCTQDGDCMAGFHCDVGINRCR